MTVAQLIKELQKWPPDMPVAIMQDINPENIVDLHWIKLRQCTWVNSNWPYDKPDFEYLDLE